VWVCWAPPAILPGSPQSCQNDALSAVISSWGTGKSRRVRSQANGGGDDCHVFVNQELSNEWCVGGRVVMVEKPVVVLPLVWTFAPNALP
jgi:hypothetical protein